MKRKWAILILLIMIGFGIGLLWAGQTHRPRVRIGGRLIEIDPRTAPDPKRFYTLQFWDYDLPLGSPAGGSGSGYRQYLDRAVAAFQTQYPRIKVVITLLDIVAGPARLAAALRQNTAPDVYASAFQIPPVDDRRQIPLGVFLTPEEVREYPLSLRRLVQQDQCLWALPRWTAPGLWSGDRELLEKYGLVVSQLRATGWTWEQLAALGDRLPAGQALLAANPAANGFFRQLAANCEPAPEQVNAAWNGQSAGAVLELLARLGNARPTIPVTSYDFLTRFYKGRALILTGTRPLFLPLLRAKMPRLALIPVPGRVAGLRNVVSENGVLSVYRNQRTRGDDQIAAAVKFARFLSCYGEVAPWLQMMVVPAAKNAAALWREKAGALIGAAEAAYLTAVTQEANLQNLNELPGYQAQIYPALLDFLAGRTTPDQAQALMFDH